VGDRDSFGGFSAIFASVSPGSRNRPELLGNLADMRHRGVDARLRLALAASSVAAAAAAAAAVLLVLPWRPAPSSSLPITRQSRAPCTCTSMASR
jgi:hypothetical protein